MVTRSKLAGMVTRVGLLDVGNQLPLDATLGEGPVVLHHPPTRLPSRQKNCPARRLAKSIPRRLPMDVMISAFSA